MAAAAAIISLGFTSAQSLSQQLSIDQIRGIYRSACEEKMLDQGHRQLSYDDNGHPTSWTLNQIQIYCQCLAQQFTETFSAVEIERILHGFHKLADDRDLLNSLICMDKMKP